MEEAVDASAERPVLIDRFLEDAIELDVDCISDGETSVIGSIMEHVELAGIHSGDSACTIPTTSLPEAVLQKVREHSFALAKELQVCGLMNIQFAIQDDEVYILEVNPRASRTVPFVSKAIGVPLAKLASLVMAGHKLVDLGFTEEIIPNYTVVKEAVFPFVRFPGIDIILSPEMKSTGEVMGIDDSAGMAYLKSQVAAGNNLPTGGNVFLAVRDIDKDAVLPLAKELVDLGFTIYATRGTATVLYDAGVDCKAIFRISRGRPNLLDMMDEEDVSWIINTPEPSAEAKVDEIQMRARAVALGVPITTTLSGLSAAIDGLKALRDFRIMEICSIQEYHRHSAGLNLPGQE